jgi:hypothetical protein
LNVAAGDLLVAWTEWQNAATGDTVVVDENDGTDTFTAGTPLINTNDTGGCFSWLINAPADASFTPRTTISNASRRIAFLVLQFRPDAVDTVTLDDEGTPASGSGTAMASNTISTTGTDEAVVGAASHSGGSEVFTSEQIGGAAADGAIDGVSNNYAGMWYKLYTSTQTNISATATASTSDLWVCNIVSFKSVAGVASAALTGTATESITEADIV